MQGFTCKASHSHLNNRISTRHSLPPPSLPRLPNRIGPPLVNYAENDTVLNSNKIPVLPRSRSSYGTARKKTAGAIIGIGILTDYVLKTFRHQKKSEAILLRSFLLKQGIVGNLLYLPIDDLYHALFQVFRGKSDVHLLDVHPGVS